jgi:fatty-acyl-CoA synthase
VFDAFLAGHRDLGEKWMPRYVRVSAALPVTATSKIIKRQLRAERWETDDPVWWRVDRGAPLRPITPSDRATIRERFETGGRGSELGRR